MPRSFAYPVGATRPTEVWLPNVFRAEDRVRGNDFSYRLQVIARLRDGVSMEQAQAQMNQITRGLAKATPRWFENRVAKVEPLRDYLTRGVRTWMFMLLAAVGFVLLIACVNLATLMLARASARTRELVIRSALGASRWDLVRALLVEGLLLALGGAALGAFGAWLGVEALRAAIPADVPRIATIAIDLRVLATTVAIAVFCGLIFSAVPALQFSHTGGGAGVMRVSRANTPSAGHQWLRGALVIVEVALAVVLLVGAGLFLVSFARVASVDLGIDPNGVLTVRVRPLVGAKNWELAQERNRGLLQNILDGVRTLPGVEVAAFVNGGVPLRGDVRTVEFDVPGGTPSLDADLDFNEISPDYFRAMSVSLLKGRYFADEDRQGSELVVIINDAAARKHFPGEDPIGRTVQFQGSRQVVGVVGNIRHDGPETDGRTQGFVPFHQGRSVGGTLVLRLSRATADVLPAVKAAIWSQFPGLALPEIQTLDQYLSALVAERRFNMLLLGLFGLLGVVIACVGIYGVMAYIVTQRTQEIGIRMALGAPRRAVLRMVIGQAVALAGIGILIGAAGAVLLARLMTDLLFGIEPFDPATFVAVSAALAAVALVASYVPGRRATRVDPVVALRAE
jgi:putative ABC transport system permease protein